MSCGGNGWLRFWNTAHQTLLAEFVAHVQGQYKVKLKYSDSELFIRHCFGTNTISHIFIAMSGESH